MKITRFQDIPPFTRDGNYQVNMSPQYLINQVYAEWVEDLGLDLNPDFQRGHVWVREQQIAFVEYFFRGGMSGRDLYFNHPGWMGNWKGDFVLVDGKQRIEAMRAFMHNEIPIFGTHLNEFEDKLLPMDKTFIIHVNDLRTRGEMLTWYIEMNTGGVVHTRAEIEKVEHLLEEEFKNN